MTLKQQFTTELEAVAQRGVAAGGDLVTVSDGGNTLRCQLTGVDTIGCAFSELSLQAPRFAGLSIEELKEVSDDLSARLNYLLEPISPIEIDSEGATVQMRSNPPAKDDDGTKYYELNVRRDGLTLRRYAKTPGQPRDRIDAQVTREVLLRLVGDFCDQV